MFRAKATVRVGSIAPPPKENLPPAMVRCRSLFHPHINSICPSYGLGWANAPTYCYKYNYFPSSENWQKKKIFDLLKSVEL